MNERGVESRSKRYDHIMCCNACGLTSYVCVLILGGWCVVGVGGWSMVENVDLPGSSLKYHPYDKFILITILP